MCLLSSRQTYSTLKSYPGVSLQATDTTLSIMARFLAGEVQALARVARILASRLLQNRTSILLPASIRCAPAGCEVATRTNNPRGGNHAEDCCTHRNTRGSNTIVRSAACWRGWVRATSSAVFKLSDCTVRCYLP